MIEEAQAHEVCTSGKWVAVVVVWNNGSGLPVSCLSVHARIYILFAEKACAGEKIIEKARKILEKVLQIIPEIMDPQPIGDLLLSDQEVLKIMEASGCASKMQASIDGAEAELDEQLFDSTGKCGWKWGVHALVVHLSGTCRALVGHLSGTCRALLLLTGRALVGHWSGTFHWSGTGRALVGHLSGTSCLLLWLIRKIAAVFST